MGGGNGVNYKNNYHVHNLSQHDYSQLDQQAKSMVTDKKVAGLIKRRSVTLKLSGLTKLVTSWTTKVEKR